MEPRRQTSPDLQTLVGLFYRDCSELAEFEEVTRNDLPFHFQNLLAHNEHMTVTVERFHGSPVEVEVLQRQRSSTHYARTSLLRRRSDGRVVQFGIVRLNLAFLDPAVRQEIESETTPLGRVLIEHDVLREVQLASLWRLTPERTLQDVLDMQPGQHTYGRTALIYCNGEPAVELLEIVTPR